MGPELLDIVNHVIRVVPFGGRQVVKVGASARLLLSSDAAEIMPAATKASRSAYSTEEIPRRSPQSAAIDFLVFFIFRHFC